MINMADQNPEIQSNDIQPLIPLFFLCGFERHWKQATATPECVS